MDLDNLDVKALDVNSLMDKATEMVMLYAPKVILALITLVVGLWVIGAMTKAPLAVV